LAYSCKNVFQIFLKFWHDLKKWRFDVHFGIFLSEVRPQCPLPNPPLPLGFTAITDHLRLGEVPPGIGPQYGAAPVKNSNQFPVAGRVECGGRWVLIWALSLSLFLTGQQAPHWSGHVPETAGLYSAGTHHTRDSLHRPGSFNLDLIVQPLLVSSEV
jgi:hypothetical protein